MSNYFSNAAVFCGSRAPVESHQAEATLLGRGLAERKTHIIYGGGDAGLMGCFSRAAKDGGGNITAVIPTAFVKPAGEMSAAQRVIGVKSLFERKDKMLFEADIAFALPGGIGTFDENAEVLAFNDLNKYLDPKAPVKPLIMIGPEDYFEGTRIQLRRAISDGYVDKKMQCLIRWTSSANAALKIYDELRQNPPVLVSSLL